MVRPLMQNFCEDHDLIALIRMSEGYSMPKELRKAYMESGKAGCDIQNEPGHVEVFTLSVETVQGTWFGELVFASNNVVDGEDRTPAGVLEITKVDEADGRLNNLLPANADKNDPHEIISRLTARMMGGWAKEHEEGCDCDKSKD